jgi:DNA-binding transcriptional LysR family regulator
MSKFDHLSLDGHLLQLLMAVVETGSVTAAAAKLEVTQSAVSHQLDKLREITGDPLFVKSGRGIVATARAEALTEQARALLRDLQRFAHSANFDPATWQTTLTIAANDFQRDLLLPRLASHLRALAPGLHLRIIPSAIPTLEMLRNDDCQLIISPRPPDGSDIVQRRLFEDQYRVFYDPAVRQAPTELHDYLASEHATVVYEPRRSLDIDQYMSSRGIQRRFAVMVPSLGALPAFVRGTPLLTTAPSLMAHHAFNGFASCPLPLPCPGLPMYLIWHQRYQQDIAHQWLRGQVDDTLGANH